MTTEPDDATLSLVAHNLRGAIAIAVGATKTVRLRWDRLDAERRSELLELAEQGMAKVDDAVFGIARGLPAEIIADLQRTFDPEPEPVPSDPRRSYPVGADEAARLEALRRYELLDQPASEDLDAITRLAARIAGSAAAAINLIDADRQWQASAYGVERDEVPREQSMCAYAMYEGGTVHLADSSADPRFAGNPFVTGDLGRVRLYASVPLVTPEPGRHVVGTICAFDDEARQLTAEQISGLEDLAKVLVSLFEERALAGELRRAAMWQHELIQDLERERRRNEHLLERLERSA